MSRVNIVKRIKIDGLWKMFSIPRNAKGNYDWNAIADGRYYVEWYVGGTRRREGAGVTAAQALEAQRRKRHELEGPQLGAMITRPDGLRPHQPRVQRDDGHGCGSQSGCSTVLDWRCPRWIPT